MPVIISVFHGFSTGFFAKYSPIRVRSFSGFPVRW